jgi:alkanesulfonate monooxygenase SsuD/methylene tetrahydromethanopterin reductase-like flavin-dependent oxidoreductase (luciferase family)
LNPMPIQRPIPVWFGGTAEPALRRTARLADGWLASGRAAGAAGRALVEQLNQFLVEAGRDPNTFGLDSWISVAGSAPEEWRKRVDEWRAIGGTHVAVDTMRAGFTTPQQHIDAIRTFRQVAA